MASYKVYFVFECSPEIHWGEQTHGEVTISGMEQYIDGDDCFDADGEESVIKSWEDAVNDLTARWESDSLSEYDYMQPSRKNPYNNGKAEFEYGTGDVNFEIRKVEIFGDDNWETLLESRDM